MPVTYNKIASASLSGGSSASIDFDNIPATYDDIAVLISTRDASTNGAPAVNMEINGVTTNRSSRRLLGNGSAASSDSRTDAYVYSNAGADYTASTFASAFIYLPNYAGSTNKSFSVDGVSENNATSANAIFLAGLWSSSAAITRLTFKSGSGTNLAQYSTAVLYGIKKS
jgi:hypothetical protein